LLFCFSDASALGALFEAFCGGTSRTIPGLRAPAVPP